MVTSLNLGQVFVYGSNLHGINAGGAARQAEESFKAIPGIGVGRSGPFTYAIPTLDGNFQKLPLETIRHYLNEFALYASSHPHEQFLLTKIGTGIAGFTEEEMESIMPPLPANVIQV